MTDAATGKPVPDVVITATSPALQGEEVVVTDSSGSYRLGQLPPGTFSLRLEKETYRPYTRPDIGLRVDHTIRVNIQLQPESLKEEIEVVGHPPTVDVGTAATGLTVGKDFIDKIAFIQPNGSGVRSFESLAAVAPQVIGDSYGFGFSGAQSLENNYIIDGISVGNPAFGDNGAQFPVEFVEEANVITGGYMAEYGKATGGVMNVVTKSGSNEFHGSVWGDWSPGLLAGDRKEIKNDASVFVSKTKLWNTVDFGGEVGGPIIKDRLWFYVGFSPSFRRTQATQYMSRLLINSAGDDFQYDTDGFILRQTIPNTTRREFLDVRAFSYIAKLTFLINSDNNLSLSVIGSPGTAITPTFFNPLRPGGSVDNANTTTVSLKYTGSFLDKHLLADATIGYFRIDVGSTPSDGSKLGVATPGDGTMMGTPAVIYGRTNPHPITDFEGNWLHDAHYVDANGVDQGPWCEAAGTKASKTVTVRTVTRYLMGCPATGNGTTYVIGGYGYTEQQVVDRMQGRASLTYLMQAAGHHIWKAGLDIQREQFDIRKGLSGGEYLRESGSGSYFYDYRQYGYFTGPDQATQQISLHNVPVSMGIGAYLQDSWSIMDVVTLNAGLRYENQQMFAGDGTLGLTLNNMLSPRVGLIYDFTQQGRSKLFANYSRYYESVPMDIADRSLTGENQFEFFRYAAANASRKGCNPLADIRQATNECLDSNNYRANYRGDKTPYDVTQAGYMTGQGKTPVDPAMQPQNLHEFLVGGEYEVISDGRLGVSYTHRFFDRVVEDMSADEASTYFLANPGYGMGAIMPKAVRDYDAVTAYFTKSFSDGWMAHVSYTWSSLRGNYNGLFRPETGQKDPNINSDFDLISLMKNRTGPLDADRTHYIKAYANKEFVIGGSLALMIGLTYEGISGSPINYYGAHQLYGPDEAFILPRGAGGRMPWRHTINAKVGVSYRITKNNVVSLSADVFNVFNFQAVTSVDETYTGSDWLPVNVAPGQNPQELLCIAGNQPNCHLGDHVIDADTKGPATADQINSNYKKPTGYQSPISARFGVKVTF